jgi:hypothetical protein
LHSIGAAIVLLTLPLDLFFQQIVAYPTVWVLAPQNATIARSVFYSPQPPLSVINGSEFLSNEPNSYAFASSYFLSEAIPYNLEPSCPTSNCTWEPFETVGVCSSCTDVASLAEFGCQLTTGEWLASVSLYDAPPNVTACGWYLNRLGQTPVLLTGYSLAGNEPDTALVTRLYNLMDIVNGPYLVPGGSFSYRNVQNPIVDFIAAASPNGIPGTLRNETPIVTECILSWCVKTLQAGYSFGDYSEIVLSERYLNTNDADNPWPTPSEYFPQFNLTLPDLHAANGSSTYGMTNLTARVFAQSVQAYIPGSWAADLANEPDQSSSSIMVKYNQLFTDAYVAAGASNPFASSNITSLVGSLAKTLTNVVRTAQDYRTSKGSFVQGQSWLSETRVQLRLEWVTLPLALLIFSLVFLITTVVASTKENATVGIWKTSALAVLFNGLSEDILDNIGSKVKMGDARRKAKSMHVHLQE